MPRTPNNLHDFARRVTVRHRPRRGLLSPIVRASICTAIACGQSPRFVAECFDVTEETVQRCLKLWELQQSFALRNPTSVAANPEDDEEPEEYSSMVGPDATAPAATMSARSVADFPSDLEEDEIDEVAPLNTTEPSNFSEQHNHAIGDTSAQPRMETAVGYDRQRLADENADPNVLAKESPRSSTDTLLVATLSRAKPEPSQPPPPTPTLVVNGTHEVTRMPWGSPKTCKACTKNFQVIVYGRQINPVRKSYFGCPDCNVALCRWGGCATVWHQHNSQPSPDLSVLYKGGGLR